jgi:hypothetical protein
MVRIKKGTELSREVYRLICKMHRMRSRPYKILFSASIGDTLTSLVLKTYDNPTHFWSTIKNRAQRYLLTPGLRGSPATCKPAALTGSRR